MNNKKSFIKFIVLSTFFLVIAFSSICVHAEPDEDFEPQISEQSVIQESTEEKPFEESYIEPEISDITEPSELSQEYSQTEPSELSETEHSDYEESYEYSEQESEFESSYYEPSYYYDPSQTEENPFPWAQESTDYYYQPEYSYEESYYYSEPEYSYPPVYYYEESSYYYYYEDDYSETTESEDESSVVYHETSVDSSELTSKDWENLKNSMSSDMRLYNNSNKSSDDAVRDIKENNDGVNDSINYLVWGLILIFLGMAIIVFVFMSASNTKKKK